jgi:GNAT superfamily N-acetyltransferase
VHPTFRGLGLGHELLEWLERRAQERGLGALRVEVPAGGGSVRQLVESAGYSEASESLPLSDVVLYEKRLSTLSE